MNKGFSVFILCIFVLTGCGLEESLDTSSLDTLSLDTSSLDASEKFIQTFLVYYGGGPTLVEEDMVRLAKFDLLDIDRFRYNDIGIKNLRENGWTIRDINPGIEIFLYEVGPEVSNYHDDRGNVITLNDLGRYNVDRDHSMGSLNGDHPELFLLDTSGVRSYNVNYSNPSLDQYWYLMDFGSPEYIRYWLEAVEADIISQPWVMDGVHVDNCTVFNYGYATPTKYPDESTWSSAMNGFVQALVTGLQKSGQKLWANRGQTFMRDGFDDWLALDQSGNAPDVVMEEGAFAVSWGENSNTRFYPEANWKRSVDLLGRIQNSRVAYLSHTDLGKNEEGVDNYNRPVTFWQSMWYALGSFLLGKDDVRDNAYFMFSGGAFNKIWWFEEYEKIDFGRATGPYQTLAIGETNIYWREFEFGYIYVNPTENDADFVELPEPGKLITHENLLVPLSAVTSVNSVTLPAHHAAFVRKASSI